MSANDYFQIYIETIAEAFRRVRKIGFKRFAQIKDLLDTVQNFLSKQVYGRIEPSNYLLAMIVILGSKTPKLYPPIISAIQQLFSYNFINPNEDLVSSLKLLRQQHRDFLLLPIDDYSNKSFKQIYIETLVGLGDRDQGLNLNVAKTLSLIWRLDQNSIPMELLPKIYDYLIDCYSFSKDQQQKMLKSVLLEMFRHALQAYRQTHDRNFLNQNNSVSLKGVTTKYGNTLVDAVAIKLDIQARHGVSDYIVVPIQNSQKPFVLFHSKQVNENGQLAGKFGWCTFCRKAANYYCKTNRLPVCSFECKQKLQNEFQLLQKFMGEQERSADVYESHIRGLFSLFKKYLAHPDVKKRIFFSQTFVLMASEIKKIVHKLSPKAYKELRGVMRQVLINIYAQTETFPACMAILRKLVHLRIFLDQTQTILRLFAKKLTYFLTASNVRDEIIRFIKDMINNRILFDCAVALDCSPQHYDAIRQVVDSLRQLYVGIPIPQLIAQPPPQDFSSKKLALQVALLILKFLQETQKKMSIAETLRNVNQKNKLNQIRNNIQRFNKSQKPIKIVKKLIQQGFFPSDPENLAKYLHLNLKRFNPTNMGILIGDYDELAGQIRKHFIGQVHFAGLHIDEAMRLLLKQFQLPGESQVVERIIDVFGVTYYNQNKQGTVLANSDAVYSLSYLLMMLQSNLHNPQVIQKMTLPQFAKLSKGMNGSPDAEFPNQFLEALYTSVQKAPLGIHEKSKQIQIVIAFNSNQNGPRKAQQIYFKDLEREASEKFENIEESPIQYIPQVHHFPIPIFIDEFVGQIIEMIACKLKDLDDVNKDEQVKYLQIIEGAMKIGSQSGVSQVVEKGIQKIWQQIQRSSVSKKYLMMEAMLEWVRKFAQKISEQWKTVLFLISRFNRSKSIRKDQNANKGHASIVIIQNKCYLYESYIENLIAKTPKFTTVNVISFLKALLAVSRDEISDGGNPFCLQKINEVLELNANRSLQILTTFWSELRDYYSELGKHKTQKVAMFAADFLKQLVTKFLKRKDLIGLQKDYLRPFEQIFMNSKIFAVKQLMIGGLNYFVSNHYSHLKLGWKTILSVVSNCFEEEEHQVIKQKAYAIVKKISQSNFTIFNLQENYTDFVQILNRLAREKDQNYALGCLQIIKEIVDYYHKKLNIDLQRSADAPQNAALDINFWQTVFLPLLSIIFPICGDSRTTIQLPAIDQLFDILVRYGKLFKYQFWKMVLQGVLRPAFEQITYTSQSKPLKKVQLQSWLKNSFTLLFKSINQLIVLYYDDFRLFLQDVFKIYQNCILNHSLKLLIMLSLDALNDLLQNIAPNFQENDWETYLFFAQSLLKKTLPIQISSLQAWRKSKDLLENNYEAKCFALYLFLNKAQQIYQRFPHSITEKIYLSTLAELEPIYIFVTDFNQNLELRDGLWKNGFYQQIKILPGLLKHHNEILRFRSRIYYKLIDINQKYIKDYFNHIIFIFEKTKELTISEHLKEPSVRDQERERISNNYKSLLLQTVINQLFNLGAKTFIEANFADKLLEETLNLLGRKIYCTRCQYCQNCQNNAQTWRQLNSLLQQLVMMLFRGR